LLSALDWLAAHGVDVINMSLAGPPNALLELVLDELAGQGLVVVAAVGNNGPTGPPLYPAAYDSVVGVTAVDSAQRIYRYANRGRQVMFAAPGVQVRVAAPAASYAVKSGTSLAAPVVAALMAESIAARQWSAAEALHSLKATAADLGEPHFDEIFGYGLVGRID
jgi:subtilisin family serine protease